MNFEFTKGESVMINKGCEVDCYFKNGFILGEEHLQTLSSMIKNRYAEEDLIYKITKSSSYIYQTSEIEEIFKEENSKANLINKLEIVIDNEDKVKFDLCFEKGEYSYLRIMGVDKDIVFLLYNEIKTYVEKEIAIKKVFLSYYTLQSICSSISSLLLLGSMFFALGGLVNPKSEGVSEALNSSDILFKLNYLISQQSNTGINNKKYVYIFFPIALISILVLFVPKILNFFWGKNGALRITDYFLFGKQKTVYDKKIKVKNNFIWSIGIGFLVSIVAGFVVYIFTK